MVAALLTGAACKKEGGTPDWNARSTAAPTAAVAPTAVAIADDPDAAAPENSLEALPTEEPVSAPSKKGLRFIAYNVENWLTMDRYVDGKALKGAPKPETEKKAVVEILSRHTPDVIGICEVGEAADLAEIQERLKAAGLVLSHSHYTGGSDPARRLGLLSRFSIVSTAKPAKTEYQLSGQIFGINRGILDATIEAGGKSYRFVGVHFKSKRDSEQGDQEAMRLHESRLLRRHVDSILKADLHARLVVYGDLNDTRGSPAVKTVTGNSNDPFHLTTIPAKDSRNDAWTHHWALHDLYSRLDFVMVSQALRKEVDFRAAKVIDDADWSKASDHRPILAIFR